MFMLKSRGVVECDILDCARLMILQRRQRQGFYGYPETSSSRM